MLDLPLRGEQPSEDLPLDEPREDRSEPVSLGSPPPPERPSVPPRRSRSRRRRRREKKRRWPIFLLFLLSLAAAFFVARQLTTSAAGFNPEAVDFDQQLVGGATEPAAVSVSNLGQRSMTIEGATFSGDSAAEFELASSTCLEEPLAPGESCVLEIVFRPAANGPRLAQLTLDGNARGVLPLSGTGAAPVVAADRSEVDFGPQPVDGRSSTRSVELSNEGSAALSVDAVQVTGAHPDDFSVETECTESELPAAEGCQVRVAFTPRAAGERLAELSVDSDGGARSLVVPLRGVGVWSGEVLEATVEELDFGKQRRGRASSKRAVSFVNRTSEPVEVAGVRLEGDDFSIDEAGCSGAALAAGAQCDVGLSFTPSDEGPASATLRVSTLGGQELTVALTGEGVEPRLSLERDELDFGDSRLEFESRSKAVLSNTGSDTVRFGNAALAGDHPDSFSIPRDGCSTYTLEPGRTCTIELRFRPTRTGTRRAELRVESDAAGGSKTVSLRGRGTSAELSARPANLDFGTVQRPGTADRTLTLHNEGTARMAIRRLALTGASSGDFVVSAIGCGESGLAPGASCRLTVRFAPRANGARAARLIVQHDASGGPLEIPLHGVAKAALPGFRLSDRNLDFGSRPVGSRSPVTTLTVTNSGDGRLELRRFSIEGSQAREFTLVPGTCDGAPYVAAGGSCTVGVRFTPGGSGRRQATLRIQHNAGNPAAVALSGQGTN